MKSFRVTVRSLDADLKETGSHVVEVMALDAVRAPAAAVLKLRTEKTVPVGFVQPVRTEEMVDGEYVDLQPAAPVVAEEPKKKSRRSPK